MAGFVFPKQEGAGAAMTERERTEARIAAARDFLSGYRLCLDLLKLKRIERRRAEDEEDPCGCEDVLMGNEAFWRARMEDIAQTIASLRNGREKLALYHRYIRGESVERAATALGISRRTAYRAVHSGLNIIGILLERRERPFGDQ